MPLGKGGPYYKRGAEIGAPL